MAQMQAAAQRMPAPADVGTAVPMANEAKDQARTKSKDSKTKPSNPVSPTFLARSSGFGGMIPESRELSASGSGIIDVMGVCDEPPLA